MSGRITTHVLNTALGQPAAAVDVELGRQTTDGWEIIGTGVTDENGRIVDFGTGVIAASGTYRLRFATGVYFERHGASSFFPHVSIEFHIAATNQHYHVPLLISPFGYTTYRGS